MARRPRCSSPPDLAQQLEFVAETGSTSADLLARITRGEALAEGYWLIADRQSGGRGRQGRAWLDAPGNFMGSTVVRLHPQDPPAASLSFVAALAVYETVLPRLFGPAALMLKWPNDLLLNGVKVSGILLEGSDSATIIGFGVNLVAHPTDTERPATSLVAQGYAAPSAHDLALALMAAFDATRTAWRDFGFDSIRNAWLARASGLGAPLVARLGAETLTGTFDGLDADGALRLRFDDGSSRAIHAGEVFQL